VEFPGYNEVFDCHDFDREMASRVVYCVVFVRGQSGRHAYLSATFHSGVAKW